MKKTLSALLIFAMILALTLCLCSFTFDSGEDYVGEQELPATGSDNSMFGLWLSVVMLGYIVPIILGVGGLVLPRVKKMGCSRMWYALSIASGVWLITSVMVTVLLAVV